MVRRRASEPVVGAGPPNDARVDPVPLVITTSPPVKQTTASITPTKSPSPSPTPNSSIVSVTISSKSSIEESSTSKSASFTTTTSSTLASSIKATTTPEASAPPTTPSQSALSSQPTLSSKPKPSSLPTGAIIGIAIGGVIIIFLSIFLACFLFRRRRQQSSRNSSLKSRAPTQESATDPKSSSSQIYSKVSTSSNQDSSSATTFGSSDTSLNTANPEMLYSYSYPDSTDGEMRPLSLAEVNARLSTYTNSHSLSGNSHRTSIYNTPSNRSFNSGDHEERSLGLARHDYHESVEGHAPASLVSLTPLPIPRKSSKRRSSIWDDGYIQSNNSTGSERGQEVQGVAIGDAVSRPGSGVERRSKAESVISELDHLIDRWDTVSIKTMEGKGTIENKNGYGHEATDVGRISRVDSRKSTSSCAQIIISDESLELLGVGRRTGSFLQDA